MGRPSSSAMWIAWEAVAPAAPAQPKSGDRILEAALAKGKALEALLKSAEAAGEPVLLVVNDPHRSTQTRPALVALHRLITESAVPAGVLKRPPRFRALVAAGVHSFSVQERREFEESTFDGCGLEIEESVWHDAHDGSSQAETAGVRMHRWVAENRFLVPIGSVEPHYFAGLTGPHKTVTIGCMGVEDIERNHAGGLSPTSDTLRLEGNPVFDGIAKVLQGLGAEGKSICAIGEVVCGSVLLAAAAGDPIEVLETLLPRVRRAYIHQIKRSVDVLRLRVPLPLGRNVYQADKALKNNHLAVRDGGGIILEADCPEGVGPGAFLRLLRRSDSYATAQRIIAEEGYRLGDHKAVKLRHLTDPACRGVRVAFVSRNLARSDWSDTGIEVFPQFEPALRWLADVVEGPLERGLIIEDAGMLSVAPPMRGRRTNKRRSDSRATIGQAEV